MPNLLSNTRSVSPRSPLKRHRALRDTRVTTYATRTPLPRAYQSDAGLLSLPRTRWQHSRGPELQRLRTGMHGSFCYTINILHKAHSSVAFALRA